MTFDRVPIDRATTYAAEDADVTLRLHQFLPPQAAIPAKAIIPWAKKVETESGGRIKIQLFHAMQMGGTPAQRPTLRTVSTLLLATRSPTGNPQARRQRRCADIGEHEIE